MNLNIDIESLFLKYGILLSQSYALVISACAVFLYEIIFISLCCQIAIQLTLLKEKINFSDENNPKFVFGEVVKHHQLILR